MRYGTVWYFDTQSIIRHSAFKKLAISSQFNRVFKDEFSLDVFSLKEFNQFHNNKGSQKRNFEKFESDYFILMTI